MPDDYMTSDPRKNLEGAKSTYYGLTSDLATAATVPCTTMVRTEY
jgi:hypothetical protein